MHFEVQRGIKTPEIHCNHTHTSKEIKAHRNTNTHTLTHTCAIPIYTIYTHTYIPQCYQENERVEQ